MQPSQMMQLPGQSNAYVLPVDTQNQNKMTANGNTDVAQIPHGDTGMRFITKIRIYNKNFG